MVIRVNDSARWKKAEVGETLLLRADASRRVRLEVNCPEQTRFDLVEPGNRRTFLAKVEGLQVLEFWCDKGGEVVPTWGDKQEPEPFWYSTSDGDELAFKSDNPSFVKIALRKERNPELERMMQRVQENVLKRQASQMAMLERRVARAEAEAQAAREAEAVKAGADKETGEGE